MLPYRPDRFAGANPLGPLEIHSPPTIVPPILTRRPQVPPQSTSITPPFSFQLISPILIISETTTSNTCTQALDLVMSD